MLRLSESNDVVVPIVMIITMLLWPASSLQTRLTAARGIQYQIFWRMIALSVPDHANRVLLMSSVATFEW